MNKIYNTIIIGSGIAGMTAAIYLKRYNLDVILFEKEIPGGQISKASIIENYPGIKSIDGASFSMNLLDQIKNLEIPLKYEEVISIKESDNIKIVSTSKEQYLAKNIIIATGRNPKKLLDNEDELIGKGLSYCATCDGMLYKNKNVIVVGGGNSALEESIYLSNICNSVTILNRSDCLRADKILIEKIEEKDNVKILYNQSIKKINTGEIIESVLLSSGEEIKTDAVFVYIGLLPNIIDINGLAIEDGYIRVDENMETNIKGIYAVGDVIKKNLYQLVTASSDGAIAANHIKNNN